FFFSTKISIMPMAKMRLSSLFNLKRRTSNVVLALHDYEDALSSWRIILLAGQQMRIMLMLKRYLNSHPFAKAFDISKVVIYIKIAVVISLWLMLLELV